MTRNQFMAYKKDEEEEFRKKGDSSSLSTKKYTGEDIYNEFMKRRFDADDFNTTYQKATESINQGISKWHSADDMDKLFNTSKQYGEKLNKYAKDYQGIYPELQQYADNYNEAVNQFNINRDFYKDYITEEAFNKARDLDGYRKKYSKMSYDDIENAKKTAKDKAESKFLNDYLDYASIEDFDKAIAAEEKYVADLESKRSGNVKSLRLDKLKSAREKLTQTYPLENSKKYEGLLDDADFKAAANDTSLDKKIAQEELEYRNRPLLQTGFREGYKIGNIPTFSMIRDEKIKQLARGAYKTGGIKGYMDFMSDLQYEIGEQFSAEREQGSADFGKENPFAMTGGYVALRPIVKATDAVRKAGGALIGEESNPFLGTGGNRLALQAGRDAVSEGIRDKGIELSAENIPIPYIQDAKVNAADVYDAFTESLGNRLEQKGALVAGTAIGSLIGAPTLGGEIGKGIANAMIGSDVQTLSYAQHLREGYSQEEAREMSTVEGLIEAGTEAMGFEWAFGKFGDLNGFTNFMVNLVAEQGEEAMSKVANTIYDNWKFGEDSDYGRSVKMYNTMGYSLSEARELAKKDWIEDLAHDFLVVGLSVGMDAGISTLRTSKAGSRIDSNKLKESMSGLKEDSEALKEYQQTEEKYGDKIPNWNKAVIYDKAIGEARAELNSAGKALENAFNTNDEQGVKVYREKYNRALQRYNTVLKGTQKTDTTTSEETTEKATDLTPADLTPEGYINRTAKAYDAQTEKLFKENYNGQDEDLYKAAFDKIRNMANDNIEMTEEELAKIPKSAMSAIQAKGIYDAIRNERVAVNRAATQRNDALIAKLDPTNHVRGLYSEGNLVDGKFVDGKIQGRLNNEDKAKVQYARAVSALGLETHVFKDFNTRKSGFVNVRNGAIYLNLAARYNHAQDSAKLEEFISTDNHELFHFAEAMLGGEINDFIDDVQNAMGKAWERELAKNLKKLGASAENITDEQMDKARKEVTADFLRRFDNADAFVRFMSQFDENKLKRWIKTVKENLTKFFNQVREIMKMYNDPHVTEDTLAMSKDVEEALKKKWEDLLVRALTVKQVQLQESKKGVDEKAAERDNKNAEDIRNSVQTYRALYSEGDDFSTSLTEQQYAIADQMLKQNKGRTILSGEHVILLDNKMIYSKRRKITRVVTVVTSLDKGKDYTHATYIMEDLLNAENSKRLTGARFSEITRLERDMFLQDFGGEVTIRADYGNDTYTDAVIGMGRQGKVRRGANYHFEDDEIGRGDSGESDIRYSEQVDSEGKELSEGQAEMFADESPLLLTKDGKLKRYYHGTSRMDRVGTVFDPAKATSGPMAYFTDDKEIAEHYSKDKADTSISRDERYDDYYTQFRLNINGKDVSIPEAWNMLPMSKRNEIKQKAAHVTRDWDGDYGVIYDANANRGLGNYDEYLIREHKGNYLEALVDSWLEGGDLFNDEAKFLDVLRLVGIEDAEYLDPYERHEGVYEVYLHITNPFDTADIKKADITAIRKAAKTAKVEVNYAADMWDKTSRTPEQWMERFEDNLESGETTVWTTIPDWVTETLIARGYDGIVDQGGKFHPVEHQVVIPFRSNQVKDINNLNPTEDDDIRFSIQDDDRVFYVNGIEVVQNPTDAEYRQMREDILNAYPWLRGSGEVLLRKTYDEEGNEYYWDASNALHSQIEPAINERFNTRTSQQYEWWKRPDKDDYPRAYRYSTQEDSTDYIDELFGNTEQVKKERATKKTDVQRLTELLKLQGTVTNGKVYNEKDLSSIAEMLDKMANSTYDTDNLTADLSDAYNKITTILSRDFAGGEVDSESVDAVMDVCRDVARNILDKQKPTREIDSYYKDITKDIRTTRVRLSDEQIQELKNSYGEDWHNVLMGKVLYAKDGIALDSVWREWATQYPALFDEETNPNDMANELLNIYDTARAASEILVYYKTAEDVDAIANEVYNKYWTVSTLRTVADKYDKQIKDLRAKHKQAMAELRDTHDEAMKKLRADSKEFARKIRAREREKFAEYKAYEKAIKEGRRENAEKKAYVDRITDTAETLIDWIQTNTSAKHVPDGLEKALVKFLNSIDFSSKTALGLRGDARETIKDREMAEALREITTMANKLDDGVLFGLDKDVIDNINEINSMLDSMSEGQWILNKMSLEDLQDLSNFLKMIKAAVTGINETFGAKAKKRISDIITPDNAENIKLGQKKEGALKDVKAFFEFKNSTPVFVFEHLGTGARMMFTEVLDGWEEYAFLLQEIEDFANGTLDGTDYKKWKKNIHTVTIGGQEVKMTEAQIMSLYCIDKREQGQRHLYGKPAEEVQSEDDKGGISIAAFGKTDQHWDIYRPTKEEVDKIVTENLTDKQREIADKIMQFFNETTSKWINETSRRRMGIGIAQEDAYFPLTTVYVDKSSDSFDNPSDGGNSSLFALLNKSFTKPINKKANNPVVIDDIFETFYNHTTDAAKYKALALPALDLYRYLNYAGEDANGHEVNMRKSIGKAHGEQAIKYIVDFLEDLNGTAEHGRNEGKLNAAVKRYKAAMVGANLTVAALQPLAIVRANLMLGANNLAKGALAINKKARDEMYANSGMALWKKQGGYDINVSRGMYSRIMGEENPVKEVTNKAIEYSLWLAGKMDEITWTAMWNACKAEGQKQGLKGDDLMAYTKDKFREVIIHTQVMDSTVTRSDMMRSPSGLVQMATAFLSEPTLTINMMSDAVIRYNQDTKKYGKREAFKRNGKYIGKCIMLYAISKTVEAIIRGISAKYRDLDDDETLEEKMWEELKQQINPMNDLPYLRDIYSGFQGFTTQRTDVAWASNAYYAYEGWKKVIEDDEDVSYRTIYRTLQALSQLSGLPMSSLVRDARAGLELLGEFIPSFKDFLD